MVDSIVLNGRYTFKHDRDFWIEFESKIENLDEFLENVRTSNFGEDGTLENTEP